MRVLFSTVSPAGYMAPPQLGEEQINCGPDWETRTGEDGRTLSLKTPIGEYDLAAIAGQLPPEQRPDVIVCLVDSSCRNLPRNLKQFNCPSVVLIGDTGHLNAPLVRMLSYCSCEPFTRRVIVYDRQHASFFQTAGFRALHWFPGITFPHSDAAVKLARQTKRAPILAFTGQTGKFHPRRCRLVERLTAAGLPLLVRQFRQPDALKFYGASAIGFNAGLNCGVNLRVFEILAGGAALITDRLAPEAGLDHLLGEGREMVSYGSPEEMIEQVQALLREPKRAKSIGAAGSAWFDRIMNETSRREAFRNLAFDGKDLPEFAFSPVERGRKLFGGNIRRLLNAIGVYEQVQELHRVQETVLVAVDPSTPPDFALMCATLPRATVVAAPDPSADMTINASTLAPGVPVAA